MALKGLAERWAMANDYLLAVGILVVWLGVAMGAGWHRCSISTSEPVWRGLDAAALGGLPSEYQ